MDNRALLHSKMEGLWDEYVHLLSTPNDKEKAQFSNYLGKTFHFQHSEVVYAALMEIQFLCHLETEYLKPKSDKPDDALRLAVSCPFYTGYQFNEVTIPTGFYTPESLVSLINTRIWAAISPAFNKDYCRLLFNKTTNRIEFITRGKAVEKEQRVSLMIFPSMTVVLGLQKPADPPEHFLLGSPVSWLPALKSKHLLHAVSAYEPGISSFDLVLVYLDCLRESSVGNQLVRIADLFPKVKCSKGDRLLCYKVKQPKYVRLDNIRSLSKISVALANERGEILKFGPGAAETRLALHLCSRK